MKNIKLLLPEKGRPLFKGKNLLERISFHEKYDNANEAESITKEEILATEVALKCFSKVLMDLEKKGLQRGKKEYEIIKEFPLFLDHQFVSSWEQDRPWIKFSLNQDVINAYEKELNSSKPSQAYTPEESYYSNILLEYFFVNAELKTILDIIEKSIYCLNNYVTNRSEKHISILNTNISSLSESLSLSEEETYALYWINILFNSDNTKVNKVWEELLEICHYNTTKFFSMIENAINNKTGFLLRNLLEDSTLVNYNFFNALSAKNCSYDIMINNNNSKEWFAIWNSIITPTLRNSIKRNFESENKSIINSFITHTNEESLPLDNWSYLNGVLDIWKLQLSEHPTKILFHGIAGCGKTSLSLSLLNELKLNIYTCIKNDLNSYNTAKKIVNYLPEAAFFIDNIEPLLKAGISLDNFNVNVICTVDSISSVSQDILSKFDYVYDLSNIPFENRLEYAKEKFADENLAIKVAQQLKTFGSINRASKIVKSSEDWKTVYPHINLEKKNISSNYSVIDFKDLNDIPNLAGYEDLYKAFDNILDLLNNPYKYAKLSAKTPKGFLIEGKPGTGKTLFVKHIAKKSQIPLIMANSSQISKNLEELKELFDFARNTAPCILFFDEIDTLLTESVSPFGIDTEKQQILNAMLTELDGVKSLAGVIVIGTTNYVRHISTRALRSGRISEVITVHEPNRKDRMAIWESYLSLKPTEKIDYTVLSNITDGFSCADICEAANQSALMAAYDNADIISLKHIDKACENVLWGRPDGQIVISDDSLWKTAIHETGHALIALKTGESVNRVTIVPRQGALGITSLLEQEGRHTYTKTELHNLITIFLGGIAAEKAFFNEFESGGSGDLSFIKKRLYSSYTSLGFSDSIGYINAGSTVDWSEERKVILEKESSALTTKLFNETTEWLTKNKELLESCAKELLEHKSISKDIIDKWKMKIPKK